MKVVVYRVGEGLYATPVEQVHSIERMLTIRPVPAAKSSVLGVANLRGNVISIQDLRVVLGVSASELTEEARLLISDGSGYVVDEAMDITDSDPSDWSDVMEQKVWHRGNDLIVWHVLNNQGGNAQ